MPDSTVDSGKIAMGTGSFCRIGALPLRLFIDVMMLCWKKFQKRMPAST